MCLNKLSISRKIHFRAHNTASSITNKVKVRTVVKLFPNNKNVSVTVKNAIT